MKNMRAINGSSAGTISLKEILDYVEKRIGKEAKIDPAGETAPYNGMRDYSINTARAQKLGFALITIITVITNQKQKCYDDQPNQIMA